MSDRPDRLRSPVTWTWLLVAAGLGLRAYHYLRDPSMWHDEAYLVLNVLGKSFRDLLGPLHFYEAGPPLFLWLERLVALALGDGTFALRLPPFLASCAALLLMVPTARRILPPRGVPWAVLLVGFSDHVLWHACEAKPYVLDVLASSAVIALHVLTRSWPLTRQFLVHALFAPLIIFLSFPGCFLYGGVLLALLPVLARQRRASAWVGYIALTLIVLGSFALLYLGPIRAQRCEEMDSCWGDYFPNWDRPWTVPGWALLACLEAVRYCFEPVGQAFAPLALLGAIRLWRRGQQSQMLLLLTPGLLPLVASCLRAYPFGGARVIVYGVPALALLIAEGACALLGWLSAWRLEPGLRRAFWSRSAAVLLVLLLLSPMAQTAGHVVVPWRRPDCRGATAYVLQRCRPDDVILGNHPEYLYYFRDLGSRFSMFDLRPSLTQGRGSRWGKAALRLMETVHPGKFPFRSVTWGKGRASANAPQNPFERNGQLWLVLTGTTPEGCDQILQGLPLDRWRMIDRREFDLTSVFLFEKVTTPSP